MLYTLLFIFIIVLLLVLLYFMYQYKNVTAINIAYSNEIDSLTALLHKECEDRKEIAARLESALSEIGKLSASVREEKRKSKSTEVRTGLIMEKMAPFMDVFEHDPENAVFLGKPIDYIVFNDDAIVFVEVKTGKARTTKKQNKIKRQVEEGKVRFEVIRFE